MIKYSYVLVVYSNMANTHTWNWN